MLNSLRSLSFSTRTLLMVLLVLGTLLRSGVSLAGELHAVGHQVHAAISGHDHDNGHDQAASAVFAAEENSRDSDHAEGLHTLLHQCGGVNFAVVFEPDALTTVPAVSPPSFYQPDGFASAFLTTPFRPPIA